MTPNHLTVVKSSFELAFLFDDVCLMFSVLHSKWPLREVPQQGYLSGASIGSFAYSFLGRELWQLFMNGGLAVSIKSERFSEMDGGRNM